VKRLLVASLLCGGCATVMVDGWKLAKDRWEYDRGQATKRAGFELSCPPDKLTLYVLSVYSGTITSQQIGVAGCDHKLVYRNSIDGWVLDSADGLAKLQKAVDR
jgi:hypothetical protein